MNNTTEDSEFLQALNDALADGAEPATATSISLAPPEAPTPPEKFELSKISHLHEAIMNWMLLNPSGTLEQCARHFKMSVGWLCTMKNNDLFKARFREKQEAIFAQIATDIPQHLNNIAEIGLSRISEKIEDTTDTRFLLESTKMALSSLGFGKPQPGSGTVNANNVQQNFYVASPADLVAARGRIVGGAVPVSDAPHNDAPAPADATPTSAVPPALPGTT